MDDREEIRRAIEPLGPIHLHYTGGFKYAGIAALDAVSKECAHSYLDPDDFVLVSRDTRDDLRNLELNLDTEFLAKLHLYKRQAGRDRPVPTVRDVERQLPEFLQRGGRGDPADGELLEWAAYYALREAFPEAKVSPSQQFQAENSRNTHCEIDASVVFGWRLVVISCTTSRNEKKAKQKAFEAIFRAQQIGGKAARAILWCFAETQAASAIRDEVRDNADASGDAFDVWGREIFEGNPTMASLAAKLRAAPAFNARLSRPNRSSSQAKTPGPASLTILATVGKNPVPVLVSVCELYETYKSRSPQVLFLCSAESRQEAKAVERSAARLLRTPLSCGRIEVDAYDPVGIEGAVRGIQHPVVLDITGGRKTFGFYAFKALDSDYHYLTPDQVIISRSRPQTPDLRYKWQLNPCDLADLHGFEVLEPFTPTPDEAKRKALQSLSENLPNGARLYQCCRFRRRGATSGLSEFQFDALVLLGYQLLVVQFHRDHEVDALKLWAIQTLARARQVGGDGAHVLFFYCCSRLTEPAFRQNIYDTIGVRAGAFEARQWQANNVAHIASDYIRRTMKWNPQ
jgi:hypothetical protein